MLIDDEEYLSRVQHFDLNAAREYKNQFVPETLYQFVSLQGKKNCQYCRKNSVCRCSECDAKDYCGGAKNREKFATLRKGLLWLAKPCCFNDPYEFKAMYPDVGKLGDANKEGALQVISNFQKVLLVSCFVGNYFDNNLPMWAHYANNHQGFCVEYSVVDKTFCYPISYRESRFATAALLVKLHEGIRKAATEKREALDKETQDCLYALLLSTMIKSIFWQYEEEWRIICPIEDTPEKGLLCLSNKLGLVPKKIYIGMYCDDDNREELITIAQHLHCSAAVMYLDDYSLDFKLKSTPA